MAEIKSGCTGFCANFVFGLPVAVLLYALWVVSYVCAALAPVAGAVSSEPESNPRFADSRRVHCPHTYWPQTGQVYFHVGPLLDVPGWEQTSLGFMLVFIVGAALWVCVLVWCCIRMCTLCEGCFRIR